MTLPGVTRSARTKPEYWRFTELSASRLFGDAFMHGHVEVSAYGNVLAATAFLYGLGQNDIDRAMLDVHDPAYEVTVAHSGREGSLVVAVGAMSLPRRTAVLSPHVDDAVISLGASIYRATRAGSYVRIVTVFSGDPDSVLEASGWDSLPGFSTEGQAVRMRRSEDAEACSVVGADRALPPVLGAGLRRPTERRGGARRCPGCGARRRRRARPWLSPHPS